MEKCCSLSCSQAKFIYFTIFPRPTAQRWWYDSGQDPPESIIYIKKISTDILTGQSVRRNFSTEVSLAVVAVSSCQTRMTFIAISAKDKKGFCEVTVDDQHYITETNWERLL